MSDKSSFMRKVCRLLGGQAALADRLGVKQQSVSYWVTRKGCFPVERVLHLEVLLQEVGAPIDRHDLRPDVYGPKSDLNNGSRPAA